MKVVCINNKIIDKNHPFNDGLKNLVEGKIYTVLLRIDYLQGYILKEVKATNPIGAFKVERFKPVDESWIESIETSINEKITELV